MNEMRRNRSHNEESLPVQKLRLLKTKDAQKPIHGFIDAFSICYRLRSDNEKRH